MKEIKVRVRMGKSKEGKNQLLVQQEGGMTAMDEIAVFEVLKQRAYEKLNKLFEIRRKKDGRRKDGT